MIKGNNYDLFHDSDTDSDKENILVREQNTEDKKK